MTKHRGGYLARTALRRIPPGAGMTELSGCFRRAASVYDGGCLAGVNLTSSNRSVVT